MFSSSGAIACVGLGLAMSLLVAAPFGALQSVGPAAPAPSRPEQFAGVWDYNAEESVNVATGRPEQDPRTGTARAAAAAKRQPAQPAPAPDPSAGTTPRSAGVGAGPPPDESVAQAYRGILTAWSRSAARDLLEVPETLTITVAPDAVTFVDDLDRSRTYATNGRKAKYQLGSAIFDAKAYWAGPQLKKEIQSVGRFQMTETYFLSEDGRRLFVVIRIGAPSKTSAKNTPAVGVNRVYDRVR